MRNYLKAVGATTSIIAVVWLFAVALNHYPIVAAIMAILAISFLLKEEFDRS